MNNVYKLKFSRILNEIIVVSELADNTDVTASKGATTVHSPLTESLEQLDNNLTPSVLGEALYKSCWSITPELNSTNLASDKNHITYLTASSQPRVEELVAFMRSTDNTASTATTSLLSNSEQNKGKVKASLLFYSALGFGVMTVAETASALTGHQVVSGNMNLVKNGSVTTITNSPNAIINWESFNIGKEEIVKFVQQSANSAVLNRVLGKQASEILGSLESNGRVFLINPNGILFGKSATVNVAELVASTLNISNEDFKSNNLNFEKDKDAKIATILNQGLIKVQEDGTLALIGGNVLNNGLLEARNGSIYLLAGKSITIADLDNPLISYRVAADNRAVNLGQIVSKRVNILGGKVAHGKTDTFSYADIFTAANTTENDLDIKITASGDVELYAGSFADKKQSNRQSNAEVIGEREGLLVANATITTKNVKGKAGAIHLLGDAINLQGKNRLEATGLQGGDVTVGSGIYTSKTNRKNSTVTVLGDGQIIDVSASQNAGSITLWGDRAYFNGNLIANSEKGKGGFIETSASSLKLAEALFVSTRSNSGSINYGTWLIDPENVYIYHNGSISSEKTETSDAWTPDGDFKSFTDTREVYISDDTLSKALNNNSIKVEATNNINFLAGVQVNHSAFGKRLTLKSDDNITIESTVIYTNFLDIIANNLTARNSYLISNEHAISGVTGVNGQPVNTRDDIQFCITKNATFTNSYVVGGNVTFDGGRNKIATFSFSGVSIAADKGDISLLNVSSLTINDTSQFVASIKPKSNGGFDNYGDIYLIVENSLTISNSTFRPVRLFNATSQNANVQINNSSRINSWLVQLNGNSIDIEDSTIEATSTTADISLSFQAKNGNIYINGSSVSSSRELNLFAKNTVNGEILINNSHVESKSKDARIEAGHLVNFSKSNITSAQSIIVRATDLKFDNSNITSSGKGNYEISIGNKSTRNIDSMNVNYSTSGVDGEINNRGDVNFHGSVEVKLNGDKIVSGRDLNISSPEGKVKVENTNACVTRSINITSKEISLTSASLTANKSIHAEASNNGEGTITLTGTCLSSPGSNDADSGTVTLKAAKKVEATNSNVTGKTGVTADSAKLIFTTTKIDSTTGAINLNASDTFSYTGGHVKSEGGAVTVNGTNGFDINSSEFKGTTITLCSSDASVNTNGTDFNATSGKFKATGNQGVNLENGTKIYGSTGVDVTSSCGSLAVNGTNISTGTGDINLKAHGEISTDNSNLSANNTLLCTSQGCITASGLTTKGSGTLKLIAENGEGENGRISVTGSKLGSKDIEINSKKSSVTLCTTYVNASNDNSDTGAITVSAHTGITLGNGTNLTAKTDIKLNSQGAIKSDGTNITAVKGDVTLNAKDSITLNNTNISGKNISLTSDKKVESNKSALASSNNITLSGKEAITVSDTNITATNYLNLTSTGDKTAGTGGTITIGNSRLESKTQEVLISGDKGVNFNNGTNISARNDVNIKADNGGICATGTNITSENGKVNLTATEAIKLTNTNVTAGSDISIVSRDKTVTIEGKSAIRNKEGSGITTVSSKKGIAISDTNITSSTHVNLTAGEGTITIGNSRVHSEEDILVNGDKGVILNNGTNLTANTDINIKADNGTIKAEGTNITTTEDGDVNLKSAGEILLNNTNISGKDIVVISRDDKVTAKKSAFDSSNNITLYGKLDVSVSDTNITATNLVNLTSGEAKVSIGNSRIESKDENGVVISGDKGVTLTNGTNISANTDIKIAAKQGAISATGTNITSTEGDVALNAQDEITLVNTNISGKDITINSKLKGVSLKDNSRVTGSKNVTVTGKDAIAIANSKVKAGNDLKVESKDKGISITAGSKLEATNNINTTARGNILIDDSRVEANNGNVNVDSTAGSVTVNKSRVHAEQGKTEITANTEVSLGNGTNISAKLDININTNGSISAYGTNITSETGNANLIAKEPISLTNTNISGKEIKLSTDKDITLEHSTVNATQKVKINSEKGNVRINHSNVTSQGAEVEVLGKESVQIGNGTNITALTKVKLESSNGSVSVTGSNVTAGENVNLIAKKDVSVVNSNISGKNIKLTADGTATVNNSRLNATEGNVEIEGKKGINLGNGTNITAIANVNLSSPAGSIKVKGSNVTAGNNVSMVAKDDVTIVNSNISGKNIKLNSTDGITTVDNSRLTAQNDVEIIGDKGVKLGNGTNISAKADVKLTSPNGSVSITGSNVTAGNNVSVVAKTDVNIVNSNISGKNIKLNSTDGITTVDNSRLTAQNDVEIIGDKGVKLGNGTNISAKADVKLTSPNGSVSITGSNVTAGNNVSIVAKTDVNIVNSNISGKNIKLKADGTATVDNSRLNATDGNVDIIGDKGVKLGNGTNISAKADVKLTSPNGSVSITGSNVTAGNNVSIVAKTDVNIVNSNISGKNIKLKADGTATVDNSRLNATDGNVDIIGDKGVKLGNGTNISAKADVKLTSPNGSVSITGSNVTAGNNVSIVAKKDVNIVNSNISGKNIGIKADNNTTINNSRLNATEGGISIIGDKNVYIGNGTNISAPKDIGITSPNGSVGIVGTNITTPSEVKIGARDKISIINSNISSRKITLNSKEQEVKLSSFDGDEAIMTPTEKGIFEGNKFNTKVKLEFNGGDLDLTDNDAIIPDVSRNGSIIRDINNSWNNKDGKPNPRPIIPGNTNNNNNNNNNNFVNPDLPDTSVTLIDNEDIVKEISEGLSSPVELESERTRRDTAAVIIVGREGEEITPASDTSIATTANSRSPLATTGTPIDSSSATNHSGETNANSSETTSSNEAGHSPPAPSNSNNNNSNATEIEVEDTSSPLVLRTSLMTCPVTLKDVYEKYRISEADRKNLSIDQNIKKYNISPPDAEQFRRLCIDNIDPKKVVKKKAVQTASNSKAKP